MDSDHESSVADADAADGDSGGDVDGTIETGEDTPGRRRRNCGSKRHIRDAGVWGRGHSLDAGQNIYLRGLPAQIAQPNFPHRLLDMRWGHL